MPPLVTEDVVFLEFPFAVTEIVGGGEYDTYVCEALQVYTAGSEIAALYNAGPVEADMYHAGAVEAEID